MTAPLLDRAGIWKLYAPRKVGVQAVQDVSRRIEPGRTYGLVGESGGGKTTVGRMVVGLARPTAGTIRYKGTDVRSVNKDELASAIQMIFQAPYSSFNPRLSVGETLMETLVIRRRGSRVQRRAKVIETLERVGFAEQDFDKLPHQFSGGQRQRIAIARAIIVQPQLVVCDEPVSALDVSLQAQVLNLLKDMQKELGLSLLFISHDMSVVRYMSDTVGVMYAGRLAEEGEADNLLHNPRHPYTSALLSAVPRLPGEDGPERISLKGELKTPDGSLAGCLFQNRCRSAMDICRTTPPPRVRFDDAGHWAECHLYR